MGVKRLQNQEKGGEKRGRRGRKLWKNALITLIYRVFVSGRAQVWIRGCPASSPFNFCPSLRFVLCLTDVMSAAFAYRTRSSRLEARCFFGFTERR